MRGKIDLGTHKLAGVFRIPARKRHKSRMPKRPDNTYYQLWCLVEPAVRDAFSNHPEYLTLQGQRSAQLSITKRVVGTLYGYGTQVPWGRSVPSLTSDAAAAADKTVSLHYGGGHPASAKTLGKGATGVGRLWRWLLGQRPKFNGGSNG